MKFKEFNNKSFYERPLIAIPAIFAIIIIPFLLYNQFANPDVPEVNKVPEVVKEDSVQLVKGKVSESEFESDYSASTWYSEFRANKVAFDKKYDEHKIDILGTIAEIKTDYGCASITLETDDKVFDEISCNNCPQGTDKWSDEVANVAVGQQVHIRGKYSANTSSEFSMDVYACHIVNPK